MPPAGPNRTVGPFVLLGRCLVILLDGDLDRVLWTTAQAAEAAGVSRDVIYQWKARGKLTPVNRRGRPRYRALDVLRAEAATRAGARRAHTAA